jgi:Gram-negative bacterial TonB protein C-terminal
MKRIFLVSVCALSGVLSALAQGAPAQAPATAEETQTGVVLTKLSPPVYPPLAGQANITGDVSVRVMIRSDGSVESAEFFSGPLMLKQAALESARASQFECRGCGGLTAYLLTYTFNIAGECRNAPDCSPVEPRPPDVRQSLSHVTVTAEPSCTCDPAVTITRIKWRSAKCLYLWRCGSRVVDSK